MPNDKDYLLPLSEAARFKLRHSQFMFVKKRIDEIENQLTYVKRAVRKALQAKKPHSMHMHSFSSMFDRLVWLVKKNADKISKILVGW